LNRQAVSAAPTSDFISQLVDIFLLLLCFFLFKTNDKTKNIESVFSFLFFETKKSTQYSNFKSPMRGREMVTDEHKKLSTRAVIAVAKLICQMISVFNPAVRIPLCNSLRNAAVAD
jgi:hypothetical protein